MLGLRLGVFAGDGECDGRVCFALGLYLYVFVSTLFGRFQELIHRGEETTNFVPQFWRFAIKGRLFLSKLATNFCYYLYVRLDSNKVSSGLYAPYVDSLKAM